MSRGSPKLSTMFDAVMSDPGFMLEALRSEWETKDQPVFVWDAIQVCIKHGRTLPAWITTYLADCANRMDDARQSADLRKVLPSIFGFPAKRGPGRPLDPYPGTLDREFFALRFAVEIAKGREPPDALVEACNVLDARRADKDDKTLWRWLKAEFELSDTPRTNAEWQTAAVVHVARCARFVALIEEKFREIMPCT
jgi:hypothetical protein